MAKTRSPEYPSIGLKEAVEKVKLVYDKDYQNKLPKAVIATHMGYKGLNGTSLPALSALAKYGLIDGRGDETHVSDLALAIIAHPIGSPERIEAIRTAAAKPELFAELSQKFPGGKGSDAAIRSFLLTQRFIPAAADTAIRSYRETMQLVEAESAGYSGGEQGDFNMQQHGDLVRNPLPSLPPKPGTERADFPLQEGMARLEFPTTLSAESYEDLEAWVKLVLRRAKRSVEGEETAF